MARFHSVLLALGMWILTVTGWVTTASAQNLLENPSAETMTEGAQLPDGWTIVPEPRLCSITAATEGHSGKRSVRFTAAQDESITGANWETIARGAVAVRIRSPEVRPGQIYTMAVWYRTQGNVNISIGTSLQGPDGFNKHDGGRHIWVGAEGPASPRWNLLQETVVIPPDAEQFYSFRVQGYLREPGAQIWIDDVRLEPARVLSVPLIQTVPALDGKLSDNAWKTAGTFHLVSLTEEQHPAGATVGRILRDAANIYIGVRCEEPNLEKVHVVRADRDTPSVWQNDRVEIFFAPRRQGRHVVHQLISNLLGDRYDGRDDDTSWQPDWDVKTAHGDGHWTLEASIPIKDLGYDSWPEYGTLRFNLVRGRKLTDGGHDFSAWGPPTGTFKAVEPMGWLIIGDPARYMRERLKLNLDIGLNRLTYGIHDQRLAGWVEMKLWNKAIQSYDFHLVLREGEREVRRKPLAQKPGGFPFEEKIGDLPAGAYTANIEVTDTNGVAAGGGRIAFQIEREPVPPLLYNGRIPLKVTRAPAVSLDQWAFVTGVPLPRGALSEPDNVRLIGGSGIEVPFVATALNRWAPFDDASIRWLRLDFQDAIYSNRQSTYTLELAKAGEQPAAGIRVTQDGKAIWINAGRLKFRVRKKDFNFIDGLSIDGKEAIPPDAGGGPYMIDHNGIRYEGLHDPEATVELEIQNPLRAVIRAEGRHRDKTGKPLSKYVIRITAFHDLPYLYVSHTFIIAEDTDEVRYRDIALAVPTPGDTAVIGLTDGKTHNLEEGDSAYLLQKTWEEYTVKTGSGDTIATGKKAPGWIASGRMAICIEDFWQNYPKELEFHNSKTQGPRLKTQDSRHEAEIRIHMWPAHGEDNPDRKVKIGDLTYLWWCHEGRELNFKPGPKYNNETFREEIYTKVDYDASMKSNAGGLAKTHDMLFLFDPEPLTPQAIETARAVFQADPHALSDPAWNCASRALGRMHPYDEERFGAIEDFASNAFDGYQSICERLNDYGMWTWGDSHSGYLRRNWNIKRIMKGTHQGRPRQFLPQYIRSGDPRYLDWARRNTRHVADVDHVHVDLALPGVTKNRGGNGYPCITHWTGEGYFGFYLVQDFMWNLFLLTGDRRMLDVIEAQEAHLRDHRGGPTGRGGACPLASTLKYFAETQDLRMLPSIYAQRRTMMSKPGAEQHAAAWGPWLRRLIEDFGDRDAVDFAVEWSRYEKARVWGIPCEAGIMAYAALESGEESLLRRARGSLEVWTDTQFLKPDAPYWGDEGRIDYARYFFQEFPYLLSALAALPEAGSRVYADAGFGVLTARPDKTRNFVFEVEPPPGEPVPITMNYRHGGHGDFNLSVTNPDGETVLQQTLAGNTDRIHTNTLPRLARGRYRVTVSGGDHNCLFRWLKVQPTGARWAVRFEDEYPLYLAHGRWFFRATPDANRVLLDVQQRWGFIDQFTTVCAVYDSTGREVARAHLEQGESNLIEIPVTDAMPDGIFKIHTRGIIVKKAEGIVPVFAPGADWFSTVVAP